MGLLATPSTLWGNTEIRTKNAMHIFGIRKDKRGLLSREKSRAQHSFFPNHKKVIQLQMSHSSFNKEALYFGRPELSKNL